MNRMKTQSAKARVLLIHSNRELSPWPTVPTGLCRVAAALEKSGDFQVSLLDAAFTRNPKKLVFETVEEFKPHIIGVSIRNIDDVDIRRKRYYLSEVRDLVITPIRSSAPDTPLVIGGSAVGVAPEMIIRYTDADYAVAGDGERAAINLFRALMNGDDATAVKGVTVRRGESVTLGAPDRIEDIDAFPDSRSWRWIDWKRYGGYGSRYGIQTKRGCDRKCTYCTYPSIEGSCYRLRDPIAVVDEIEQAYRDGGVERFEFVDSTFNIPRGHALSICKELASRKLDISMDTMGFNPGMVDEELVATFIEAGFTEISCTPESATPEILRALGKQFTIEDIENAAGVLKKAGLPTKWYFMFGAPGETEETIERTFGFIDRHISPGDLVICMSGIRILPGTAIEKIARREGRIGPDETLLHPVWITGDLSPEQLLAAVEHQQASRPNCCNASGEIWNIPFLMRGLHTLFSTFKIKDPGYFVVAAINRIRRIFRS